MKAEDALIALEVANFPNIKKSEDRRKIIKKYSDLAQIKKEAVTGHEMARKLNAWRVKK